MSRENTLEASVRRQDMYKLRTPPWKETYRKRCLDRLRENRARHHLSKRHLCLDASDLNENVGLPVEGSSIENKMLEIDAIMEEEWRKMGLERRGDGGALCEDFLSEDVELNDGLIQFYSDIQEEIKRDLQREEQKLLSLQDLGDLHVLEEEEALCSDLKALTTKDVLCPLCTKGVLLENKGVIICQCGLRIDTEQDCISLKYIQDTLDSGAAEHSENCEATPSFQLSQKFGITNLLMVCQACDFLYVIV
ncbi:RPA-interacting protein B-like [Physella acuta]|uniref:RPA-interacting protein B-like n=1 Tax=Physella acuta TaxID=109671 RepID=UPI0027DC71E6|nr:RPA-interacting protein B-like [Physella acuta]XP_059154102.1 RPA-interacting protein B-like [Physella acuta]